MPRSLCPRSIRRWPWLPSIRTACLLLIASTCLVTTALISLSTKHVTSETPQSDVAEVVDTRRRSASAKALLVSADAIDPAIIAVRSRKLEAEMRGAAIEGDSEVNGAVAIGASAHGGEPRDIKTVRKTVPGSSKKHSSSKNTPTHEHHHHHHHHHRHHHQKQHKEEEAKQEEAIEVVIPEFPPTETFLQNQTRQFRSHRESAKHWAPDGGYNYETGNGKRVLIRSKPASAPVKEIVYPSMLANGSLPFETRPCYRQVHLWSKETRSFSGRVGDFPCPGLPCGLRFVVDTDVASLKSSDAVILFHRTKWDWAEMHHWRPRGQKWIFYTQESPINTAGHVVPPRQYYNNSYDYIMTYRSRESHLYGAYGRYIQDYTEMPFTKMYNWAQNRSRSNLVAWMASNCNSVSWDRKGFVEALAEYVPVSMYGQCGNKVCTRDERCNRQLRRHKFYLALENSACRDYITEKLWRNAFLNNLVPIVYGPPRADYEAVLPPDSFIHVEDFDSIRELAEFLQKLNKDEGMYNTYFEWKKFGRVQLTIEEWLFEPEQVCTNIVDRLLRDEKAKKEGTFYKPEFPDWHEWWTNSCDRFPPKWPIRLN